MLPRNRLFRERKSKKTTQKPSVLNRICGFLGSLLSCCCTSSNNSVVPFVPPEENDQPLSANVRMKTAHVENSQGRVSPRGIVATREMQCQVEGPLTSQPLIPREAPLVPGRIGDPATNDDSLEVRTQHPVTGETSFFY